MQFPEDQVPGSEAGRLSESQTVAVDPTTRHVFVAEWQGGMVRNNNRISEFTAWGEFVKTFGWGVRDGADKLQVCTGGTGCQKGLEGSQPGQFNRPNGLAFDAAGNLYVFERLNARVQKFDPTAGPDGKEVHFLDEWGGAGTADGQFAVESLLGVNGSYIAVDRSDEVTLGGTVYVTDKGRIQAFRGPSNPTHCPKGKRRVRRGGKEVCVKRTRARRNKGNGRTGRKGTTKSGRASR